MVGGLVVSLHPSSQGSINVTEHNCFLHIKENIENQVAQQGREWRFIRKAENLLTAP